MGREPCATSKEQPWPCYREFVFIKLAGKFGFFFIFENVAYVI